MHSLFSREALFLLNNLLFMGVLIVCFWGVIFPLISELATGQKVTVGPPFYLRANGPLFGALMALMGIAPLSAWGRSTYKTLGRALWKPSIPTAMVPVVLAILGVRNWIALVGFTLVAFVIFVTLYEFWRAWRKSKINISRRVQWTLIILLILFSIGAGVWIFSDPSNFLTPVVFLFLMYFLIAIWILARRNPRRYGGYLIHLSMVVMAIGILGMEVYQTTTQKTLAVGENMQLAGYTLRYDSLAQFPYTDGRIVTRAVVSVFRNGTFLGELFPRYDVYPDGQPMTIAGVRSTLTDDLYVVLVNWENVSAAQAPFKVYHNPLVNWLWIGSLMFIFGFLVAAWPEREKENGMGNYEN